MTIEVEVQFASSREFIPGLPDFRNWVTAALGCLETGGALGIRIVDAVEGAELNLQYRGVDAATNVLSFASEIPPELCLDQLGDLVLCAPVVAREATEQGKPEIEHWAHMTVHGVLHLLGYDHQTESQAAIMESLEVKILASLGIPDPYRPG